MTPFEAIYGRPPPCFLPLPPDGIHPTSNTPTPQHRSALLLRLQHNLQLAQAKMTTLANKKRKEKYLNIGDLVLLRLHPYRQRTLHNNKCKRFSLLYYGPYHILERTGQVAYRLNLPSTYKLHPVFHISLLKPYLSNTNAPIHQIPSTIDPQLLHQLQEDCSCQTDIRPLRSSAAASNNDKQFRESTAISPNVILPPNPIVSSNYSTDSLQEHHTNGNRDNSSTPNITTETNQVTEQHSLASPYRDVSTSSPIVIPSKRVATTSNLPSHFCRPAASPPPPKTATWFGKRRLNRMTPTANNQESDESIPTIEDMDNPAQPPTAPPGSGIRRSTRLQHSLLQHLRRLPVASPPRRRRSKLPCLKQNQI